AGDASGLYLETPGSPVAHLIGVPEPSSCHLLVVAPCLAQAEPYFYPGFCCPLVGKSCPFFACFDLFLRYNDRQTDFARVMGSLEATPLVYEIPYTSLRLSSTRIIRLWSRMNPFSLGGVLFIDGLAGKL
ncbi:MAG: hypothetical protein KDE56_32740, partial [Anaerolineales bacterium]|nr:hypothetical protein [Anaerolineales bacterium]